MVTGSNDLDYQNLADQFQGSYLWLNAQYPKSDGSTGVVRGSAVRLNEDWVLTAAHNLYAASAPTNNSITVGNGSNFTTSPGTTISCSTDIIMLPGFNDAAISNGTDLALVRLLSPLSGPTLALGSAGVGELVYEVGFGKHGTPATGLLAADGNVRAFEAYVSSAPVLGAPDYFYNTTNFGFDGGETLALNGRGAPGDSGSGVFNSRGELVGIATGYNGAPTDPFGTTYYMDLTNPEVSSWILSTIATSSSSPMHLTASVQNNHVTVVVENGSPGATVTLQSSTDLQAWADSGTVTLSLSGTGTHTETINGPQRFFRVKLP